MGKFLLFPQNSANVDERPAQARFARILSPEQLIADDVSIPGTTVPFEQGETLVRVLPHDFDPELPGLEQMLVSQNHAEQNGFLSVTYLVINLPRSWSIKIPITRPWTVALDVKDLLGNHTPCVLISGTNETDDNILVVLRKNPADAPEPFSVIAEITSKGSIAAQESARNQAYQRGNDAESFPLVAFAPDTQADNPLDQVETTYAYNPALDRYTQSSTAYITTQQIEARSIQKVINGGTHSFETFVEGLWYFIGAKGVDTQQYIYFDPANRELVFYGADTQQVFIWQTSSSQVRSRLSITAQNISVTTLRRSLDVELDTPNRIQVWVSEDVKLKISSDVVWNGAYQKAEVQYANAQAVQQLLPYVDAEYQGGIGNLAFASNGTYELASEGISRKGKYAFFNLNGEELLEFRPATINNLPTNGARETYLVTHVEKMEGSDVWRDLTLLPVRIGVQGIQRLRETPLSLVEHSTVIVEEPVIEEENEVVVIVADAPVPVVNYRSRPEYFSPDNDGVDDELSMFFDVQTSNPIVSWNFTIREPQSSASRFYYLEGSGNPPQRINWNGKSNQGELVQAATDYPFLFTVTDTNGTVGLLNGIIGVDVLIAREGNSLRIQVPSIIFRGDNADFVGLGKEIVDNNNRVLRRIAEILSKFQDYRVQVEGHANRSTGAYDEQELVSLSESRARAVVNMLVEFGVNRNRLTAIGMGAKKPIAAYGDVDNYWKNRRVEFLLLK
jgi:flagellar motor protein MotB